MNYIGEYAFYNSGLTSAFFENPTTWNIVGTYNGYPAYFNPVGLSEAALMLKGTYDSYEFYKQNWLRSDAYVGVSGHYYIDIGTRNTPPVTYTFETDGGSMIDAITSDEEISLPIPTRSGYRFMGWYDNPDCSGTALSSPYKASKDITIYAKWISEASFNGDTIDLAKSANLGSNTASITVAGTTKYFVFIPTSSGYYNISSSYMFAATNATLYDENKTQLKSNSGKPTFSITHYLDAGKEYYISIAISSGSATKIADIPFKIEVAN